MSEKSVIYTTKCDAVKLVLSAYLGEKCKYCLKEFKTIESLDDAVWVGYHEHGRLAHEKCWKEHIDE